MIVETLLHVYLFLLLVLSICAAFSGGRSLECTSMCVGVCGDQCHSSGAAHPFVLSRLGRPVNLRAHLCKPLSLLGADFSCLGSRDQTWILMLEKALLLSPSPHIPRVLFNG